MEEMWTEAEQAEGEMTDIYNDGEGLLDDDEISPAEQGFMLGYNEA